MADPNLATVSKVLGKALELSVDLSGSSLAVGQVQTPQDVVLQKTKRAPRLGI